MRWLVFAVLLTLAACGSLLPSQGPAPDLYTLSPATRFAEDLKRASWQLMIEEPTAVGGVDSNRIAVQPTPNEVRYFGEVRWVERAPRMVQGLLVESFERSRAVAGVERYTVTLKADYLLKVEIRDFQAELFGEQAPTVHVRLTAKLLRVGKQDILWTRDFEARAAAGNVTASNVVAAFDAALGQVMADIVAATVNGPSPQS
jgi:cholesterol transport system auxiliary component